MTTWTIKTTIALVLTIRLALWLAEASPVTLWLLQTALAIGLLVLGLLLGTAILATTRRNPVAVSRSTVRYLDDGSIEATYSIE